MLRGLGLIVYVVLLILGTHKANILYPRRMVYNTISTSLPAFTKCGTFRLVVRLDDDFTGGCLQRLEAMGDFLPLPAPVGLDGILPRAVDCVHDFREFLIRNIKGRFGDILTIEVCLVCGSHVIAAVVLAFGLLAVCRTAQVIVLMLKFLDCN